MNFFCHELCFCENNHNLIILILKKNRNEYNNTLPPIFDGFKTSSHLQLFKNTGCSRGCSAGLNPFYLV